MDIGLFFLQHPEHAFALLADLFAEFVIVFVIFIALLVQWFDALRISRVRQLEEYGTVITRS